MFSTDQALWYNNGAWGELGYACPNFGNDPSTLNDGIYDLVGLIGRNLSAIMHHPDVDLRTPPSINTLTRIHKLIVRARTILAGRAVDPGTPNMEAVHTTPAQMVFLVYPVPYFKVRNPHLKSWCGLMLNCLSEAMQHTENRNSFEVSTRFSGIMGQYLHRVYQRMATEMFGVPAADAKQLNFTLTNEQLAGYDPGQFFTSTEMIDTIPQLHQVPTEDDLRVLTDGILATQIVGLSRYPDGIVTLAAAQGGGTVSSTTGGDSFVAPPTP